MYFIPPVDVGILWSVSPKFCAKWSALNKCNLIRWHRRLKSAWYKFGEIDPLLSLPKCIFNAFKPEIAYHDRGEDLVRQR